MWAPELQATIESGPLIYAAMEMKMAVASDLQLFKSLEAAQWPDEVEATWSEHEKIAVQFTALGNAILKGGETEAGVIQATQDERLQQVVTDTLQFYDASFHAKFKMLADLITRKSRRSHTIMPCWTSWGGGRSDRGNDHRPTQGCGNGGEGVDRIGQ
jgi:hypothetical protein